MYGSAPSVSKAEQGFLQTHGRRVLLLGLGEKRTRFHFHFPLPFAFSLSPPLFFSPTSVLMALLTFTLFIFSIKSVMVMMEGGGGGGRAERRMKGRGQVIDLRRNTGLLDVLVAQFPHS